MLSAIQFSLILGLVLLVGTALLVETHSHEADREEARKPEQRNR